MTEQPWDLVFAGPARRTIDRLPEKLAIAVLDFILGPLLQNPHLVGKALRGKLVGLFSVRVGAYRVVHSLNESDRVVSVVFVDHRADVYRPR